MLSIVETDDASYDVVAQIEYRAGGAVSVPCLEQYVNYVRNFYGSLNDLLSGRCSAINVKMDISFHNTTIRTIAENTVRLCCFYKFCYFLSFHLANKTNAL